MISILTLDNAKTILSENAVGMPIPWAFIKESFFAFVEHLYSRNILFTHSLDSDTFNKFHLVFEKKLSASLAVNGDNVVLLHQARAKEIVNEIGREKLQKSWDMVGVHVDSFLDYLYMHNIFVARAEGAATVFLQEKLQAGKNLKINLGN